ncbi:MAG: hypothetical protein ACLUDH_02720 [Faecalispora sporosphaeroides]|nr:hypothetical protein [Faecalispora sporosphaeroides]
MPEAASFAKASANSIDEFTLVGIEEEEYQPLYQEVSEKYF